MTSAASQLLWQAAKAAGLLVALPTAAVLLLVLYLATSSLARFVQAALGLDRYAHIPSAKHRDSWFRTPFLGDFMHVAKSPTLAAQRDFMADAGGSNVVVNRSLFYKPRLQIVDPAAYLHMFQVSNNYDFPKPRMTHKLLVDWLGLGLVTVEGDIHKRQRRICQPAFNVSAIRELTPCFYEHSRKLVQRLDELVAKTHGAADKAFLPGQSDFGAKAGAPGAPVIDVVYWLARATLDIIGAAGFGWQFKALDNTTGEEDELAEAFNALVSGAPPTAFGLAKLVLQTYPGLGWLRKFHTKRDAAIAHSGDVMRKVSTQIVEHKRRQILAEMSEEEGREKKSVTKADWELQGHGAAGGKDLMMLMMRSNMSQDLPESERLPDAELVGQISTLLLAGHETTASLTSWALHEIARQPDIQHRLRAEIKDYTAGRDELSYDELSSMPFLDAVVKETMRLSTPVPFVSREAAKDSVLPLSRAYPTRNGKGSFDSVVVKKGDEIMVQIGLINTSRDLWGDDALQFKPDRWSNVPAAAKHSGLPLQVLTFITGPRSCIGNRFAIAEAKVLLIELLSNFKFEWIDGWELERRQGIVMRGRVPGQESVGLQMPLRISRVDA